MGHSVGDLARERQRSRAPVPEKSGHGSGRVSVIVFAARKLPAFDRDERDLTLDSRSAVDRRRVPSRAGQFSWLQLTTSHLRIAQPVVLRRVKLRRT